MNEEWKIYRKKLRKSTKSVFLALGVSLLFYLVAIPNLKPDEHIRYILISLLYGFVVFAWIWVLYAGLWAVVTKNKIKTGRDWKIAWKIEWRVHLPIGVLGMSGGLISAKWIKACILGQQFTLSGMWESFLIGAFIALMFQFYYAYKHSAQENLELKAAKTEAELHVLKNQMQPHFLFNSLNSLAELIESNKNYASAMTHNLADLYREILENSKQQLSTVQSEISIINKYLALEKLRFGERLNYKVEELPNGDSVFIPSLVLQTLVENAVKHGVAPSTGGGTVHVKVLKNGSGFKAEISNTGTPIVSHKNNKGTGLENTKSRLDLLYGDKHQFKLDGRSDEPVVSFLFSGDQSVR
ncbi:MAG: histidine kinase [Bdellovibrionota bacterium]